MKIELGPEQADDVVTHELKDLLKGFRAQSVRRANGHGYAVFKNDLTEDLKIIKKHIAACKLLLKYYGVKA
jgi:hypothetical protein